MVKVKKKVDYIKVKDIVPEKPIPSPISKEEKEKFLEERKEKWNNRKTFEEWVGE